MEAVQTSQIRWYKGKSAAAAAAADSQLVKLSIDGKEVEAPLGTFVPRLVLPGDW